MNSASDKPVRYLTFSELCNINHTVTEGHSAVRDPQLLRSAVQRPRIVLFGESQFPTLLDKAAALLHSLAYHHLFFDGNKRTAALATEMFLEFNGSRLTADPAAAYAFILEVAQGKHAVESIAVWLQGHTGSIAPDR
jgi:death-on-curing protein